MNYEKMRYIEEFDDAFEKIKNMDDFDKRYNLVKSYLGQWNYCICKRVEQNIKRRDTHRRVKRDPDLMIQHAYDLADAWQERIDRVLSGEPLENFVGKKLECKSKNPLSMKHSARYHIHQERLNKKRAKRKAKRLAEAQKEETAHAD